MSEDNGGFNLSCHGSGMGCSTATLFGFYSAPEHFNRAKWKVAFENLLERISPTYGLVCGVILQRDKEQLEIVKECGFEVMGVGKSNSYSGSQPMYFVAKSLRPFKDGELESAIFAEEQLREKKQYEGACRAMVQFMQMMASPWIAKWPRSMTYDVQQKFYKANPYLIIQREYEKQEEVKPEVRKAA